MNYEIKRKFKGYIKYILQNTLLPLCYELNRHKPLDDKLVIFADSNCDTLPESMVLLWKELKSRGYKCKKFCLDFSKASVFAMLKFMCGFMAEYARARAVVICNYFVPIHACKKRRGTYVLQLWHSCGALKKFGWTAENDISPDFRGSVAKNIDLVTVSSKACVNAFRQAFHLKKGIALPVGVSRTDVFFDEEYKKRCYEKLYRLRPDLKGKKILLYLPTFRGNAGDAYSVGHEQILALREDDGLPKVLIRMHPRVKKGIRELTEMTANELMICADILVTDYSSAVFEYALLDRPMILWCPDLKEYLHSRNFFLDFEKDMPCPIITDAAELKNAVLTELQNFTPGKYKAFVNKYLSACDGQSTERIADMLDICHHMRIRS